VAEKKIAGILIENALQGENILHSVAGIGINVNQDNFPDWIPNPTSMKILTGRPFEVREVLNAFLKAYWEYYFMLKDQQFQNLRQHYLDHLYRYESWGIYWSAGKTFKGMITGIEDNGLLCMKNLKGKTLKFAFKEVEFIH
jgi:BirA family biotin operon repressor/biotin-[acetyl-CoA-carboxylase] ligase